MSLGEVGEVDVGVDLKADALGLHHADAPVDDGLVELEVGDAEAQQSSDVFQPLEDGDLIAAAVELVGSRQSGRSRTDDRHPLPVPSVGAGLHVAFAEGSFDDGGFVLPDGDGCVDAELQHTALFAQRRADASGELGEVVRLCQDVVRLAPLPLVEGVLELRRAVAQRTGPVAERHAAVHAARGL